MFYKFTYLLNDSRILQVKTCAIIFTVLLHFKLGFIHFGIEYVLACNKDQ